MKTCLLLEIFETRFFHMTRRSLLYTKFLMHITFFQKNYRHVKGLISVSAAGEHCVLATNHEDSNGAISNNTFTLLLCNALGTPIDTKQVSPVCTLK